MTSSDLPRNRSGRLLSQSQFLPKPISNTLPASCSSCVFLSPFLLLQAFIYFHLKNCCNGASTRRESHKGKEGVTAQAWQLLSNRHGRLFNWCAFGNDLEYWAGSWATSCCMDLPAKDRVSTSASGLGLQLRATHPRAWLCHSEIFKSVSSSLVPALSKHSGFSVIFEFGNVTFDRFFSLKTKSFALKISRPGSLKVI